MNIELKISEIRERATGDDICEVKGSVNEIEILSKKLKEASLTLSQIRTKAIQKINSEEKRLRRLKKANIIRMSSKCWDIWDIVNENISINEQTAISYRGNFLREIGLLLTMKSNKKIKALVKSMVQGLVIKKLDIRWHEESVKKHTPAIKKQTINQLILKYAPELKGKEGSKKRQSLKYKIEYLNVSKTTSKGFFKIANQKMPAKCDNGGWGQDYNDLILDKRFIGRYDVSYFREEKPKYDEISMTIIPQVLDNLREYDKKAAIAEESINNEFLSEVDNLLMDDLKQMITDLEQLGITTNLAISDNLKLKASKRIYLEVIAVPHSLIIPVQRLQRATFETILDIKIIALTDGSSEVISINPKWTKIHPQKNNDTPTVTSVQGHRLLDHDLREYGVEAKEFLT